MGDKNKFPPAVSIILVNRVIITSERKRRHWTLWRRRNQKLAMKEGHGVRDSKILNHTRTLSKVSAQKDKLRPVRMARMFCLLALPFAISRCPDTEEEWTVNWS